MLNEYELDWNELCQVENFMQTLEILIYFLVKTTVKFRNLQISKIRNSDTNEVFPIPLKLMYKSLRYT